LKGVIVILKNEKGSAAVFISIVLTSILTLLSLLYVAAGLSSARSENDARLRLASRSVLSEYDRELFSKYGLVAFKADEREIEQTMKYFCKNLDSGLMLADDEILSIEANAKGHSITDANTFASQIEAACLNSFLDSLRGDTKKLEGIVSNAIKDKENTKVLRRTSIKQNLPSKGFSTAMLPDIALKIPDGNITEYFSQLKSKLFIDEYILTTFKYAIGGQTNIETFFENEVEYILYGSMDDKENYEKIKGRLWAYRYLMNNIHIVTDKKKMEVIANWASKHPVLFVATLVIVEIWAMCETNNDILLLERGEKVPAIKRAENWALDDLDAIMGMFKKSDFGKEGELLGEADKAYDNAAVLPNKVEGLDYKDHIRALLLFSDRNTKLLRMMDLIQINMKGRTERDFILGEYATGFEVIAKTNRENYEFISKY
jgi:hypothetical protein